MRQYQKLKNAYHLLEALGACLFFGFPSREIKIIGVTGTNGKTTTVWMINKILEEAGFKTAVSSTINFKIGDKEWVNKTKFTTRSAWAIQKFIRESVRAGCEYLVMETSSHALDQNRVWGVSYDVGVITNITREHLDYHGDMEKYKEAKLKLFRGLAKESKFIHNLRKKGDRAMVVNSEMAWASDFLKMKVSKKYGYGLGVSGVENQTLSKIKKSKIEYEKVIAKKIKTDIKGGSFEVNRATFKLSLPGKFNIENALAGICVGLSQGVSLEKCSSALSKIDKIPGRMDYVENNRGLKIIIDYALTPDSMEKLGQLLENERRHGSKFIWVFGACGERDRGKRPTMGRIVSSYADTIIVTNEDPYGEDPEAIMEEIMNGIEKEKVFRILDRKEAIKKALNLAQEGDVILITGKGAEETMAVGSKRIPWNDKKVVKELLLN